VLLLFGFVITELSVMEQEQRYQAVLEVEAGTPVVEVARGFGVSRQAIHRWVARYRGGGLPWEGGCSVSTSMRQSRNGARTEHPRTGARRQS
jgi:transposase-like protein